MIKLLPWLFVFSGFCVWHYYCDKAANKLPVVWYQRYLWWTPAYLSGLIILFIMLAKILGY